MVHHKAITCPICGGNETSKQGKTPSGAQRFRCHNEACTRGIFQDSYTYKANEPGVKEKIDDLIVNSSGVRDTARVLGINKNTVCSHLKKKVRPR